MATTLEHCTISPPQDAAAELSLPIIFLDMLWYDLPASQSVLFFDFPSCSKPHFLNHVVPSLKHSLSLTLAHFLPLAGKIIHPLSVSRKPVLSYVAGRDSVSFTVAEAKEDNFNHLTGNHPRHSGDFYAFVPQLPPPLHSPDSIQFPVLAVKVTSFPGHGLCFGFAACHAFVDASTIVSFIRAWALINSQMPDSVEQAKEFLLESNLFPLYDRKNFVDINGLDSIFWNQIAGRANSLPISPAKAPSKKVRATFVLKKQEIQKLKNFVLEKLPGGGNHLSSFTVVCALVWSCLAKSARPGGEDVPDDEPDYFSFVADCRGRATNPTFPRNYFGNCCKNITIGLKHGDLKGANGFILAASTISKAVREQVYGEEGILHDAAKWLPELWDEAGQRVFNVEGSPRFDFYTTDFGWGRPIKFEALLIDHSVSIALCKPRWEEGGLEISMSRSRRQMEAFVTALKGVLGNLGHVSEVSVIGI